MAKFTYYKLNKKATMFYCPVSRLKVVKNCPGKLDIRPSKKVDIACTQGHIIPISKEDYNELMEVHNENIEKAHELSREKRAEKAKILELIPEKKVAPKAEEVEDEDEDEDEKKSLKKMNRDELEEEVKELEDITEEKIEEVMEGNKNSIVEFIEEYDPSTDAEVEGNEDEDEDEDEDEEDKDNE